MIQNCRILTLGFFKNAITMAAIEYDKYLFSKMVQKFNYLVQANLPEHHEIGYNPAP
jgi:hypothetical protein